MVRRVVLAVVVFAAVSACAQECPQPNSKTISTPSKIRSLEGKLIYHDGIRQWFELRLDHPQCGQKSIQLTMQQSDWTPLEILRGCRVRTKGSIDFTFTGYYSLDLFQDVKQIQPVGDCRRQPPFPSYSDAKPDPSIQHYRVEMFVDYRPGDHPILFQIRSGGKKLRPWQAYASYMLTGDFVLDGFCGKGFAVDQVFGTPAAGPSHLEEPDTPDDMALFDPESAAHLGKTELHLGYTCVRIGKLH